MEINQKHNKKKIILIILCIIIIYYLSLYLFNYRYYSVISKQKCEELKEYCINNNFNSDYCIIVDFSKYSGNRRIYIYDLGSNTIIFSGRCAHGYGKNNIIKGIINPEFSNIPNSYNSSLGKYKLGKQRVLNTPILNNIPCIELYGLDNSNSNTYSRHILIHPGLLTDFPTTPFPTLPISQGCFGITSDFYSKISTLINNSNKPILLYAFT